ncbi:hypothetical protein [Microscilla marina]|uniref:Uncharacterized protein n=1 Tax=Microscilla marina ATCC 23134 TaxID=313606 RepID=A1ZEM0_MICM2|nr:hypothetical protein [Microscilla marina]EAY30972.1 hypothetical protein M23134_07379 [Microscilla marina ATCC 23134]
MTQIKQYNKEELREMLPEAFKRYHERPTLLVLSDTNIFADDPGGRSLAVKHSHKFHARIFRFQNPEYAEGRQEQAFGVIEDVEEEEATPGATKASAKATPKKTGTSKLPPEKEEEEEEGDIAENLAQQVKADEKAAEAKKTATTVRKSGTAGVKAKK